MNCQRTQPINGCLTRQDGSTESIVIHYTYASNGTNNIPTRIHYTDAADNIVTLAAGDSVSPGACNVPSEIELQSVSIVDFEANGANGTDGPVSGMEDGGYTTDIDALPIAVPAGSVLPVQLNGFEQEYYQGNGNFGTAHISARVAFPSSYVVPSEIQLPTISVIAWDDVSGNGGDDDQDLINNGYTLDTEALAIATLPDVYLNTQLRAFEQDYYQGDGQTGSASVNAKVVFPDSAVIKVEDQVVTKTATVEDGTFTTTQVVAAGFTSATVQVKMGSVTINGMTVDSCSPHVLPVQSHGSCRVQYGQMTVTAAANTEFNLSVQRV